MTAFEVPNARAVADVPTKPMARSSILRLWRDGLDARQPQATRATDVELRVHDATDCVPNMAAMDVPSVDPVLAAHGVRREGGR